MLSLLAAAQPGLLIKYCMLGAMLEFLVAFIHMLSTTLFSQLPLSSQCPRRDAMGRTESWLMRQALHKGHCDFFRDSQMMGAILEQGKQVVMLFVQHFSIKRIIRELFSRNVENDTRNITEAKLIGLFNQVFWSVVNMGSREKLM